MKSNMLERNMEIIKIIIDIIGDNDIKWILSGSTSLVLQGVALSVNDIDILTDEEGSKKLDLKRW